MAAAICRWLRRRGVRVAPFKAQNMSNNSYPCAGGGEIGRAQAAQAAACGIDPTVDMNPILLKPAGEMRSQVVVQGKVWRDLTAREYYEHHVHLSSKVGESFDRLAEDFDYVVVEGAGGLAEINLRESDLVNLGFARLRNIPVLLVADIDRGGVFASIYGTLALLDDSDASAIRAFAVNRFRGDVSLFAAGVKLLEEKTARPCLGVFPFAGNVHLDEEDSVALDHWRARPADAPSIAIVRFPRVSNFTDFRLLSWAVWLERPVRRQFDFIVLPGSKNTSADLGWMRGLGFDRWLREQHEGGASILGVCGGYQMLGEQIEDPYCVESDAGAVAGLGMLPVTTRLAKEKMTRVVRARTPSGREFSAYEIHMGETAVREACEPFAIVEGRPEGIRVGRCAGTYLHGVLESADVVEEIFGYRVTAVPNKEESFERLADWFEEAADVALFERLFL